MTISDIQDSDFDDDIEDDVDLESIGLNDDESQPVRKIMTAVILVCEKGALAVTTDPSVATSIMEKVKDKVKVKQLTLTSNLDRINELAKNCITLKLPEAAKKDPIKYRNEIIRQWINKKDDLSCQAKIDEKIAWNKFRTKMGIPECTYDEFSKWILDYNEYVFGQYAHSA